MSDSDDFRMGFIAGFRSVCVGNVVVPVIPPTPVIRSGNSAFRIGLLLGEKAAKV